MSDLSPKAGDVNGDGVVNQVEVAILTKNFYTINARRIDGDVGSSGNGPADGVVDIVDATIVSLNYAP
jgi:hypothetical protein